MQTSCDISNGDDRFSLFLIARKTQRSSADDGGAASIFLFLKSLAAGARIRLRDTGRHKISNNSTVCIRWAIKNTANQEHKFTNHYFQQKKNSSARIKLTRRRGSSRNTIIQPNGGSGDHQRRRPTNKKKGRRTSLGSKNRSGGKVAATRRNWILPRIFI